MGDVGEGPRMDEGGTTLHGLDEIGLDGVAQQDGHGAGDLEILHGDGAAIGRLRDDDAADATPHILQVCGQGEDGHDLGRGRDVELALTLQSVRLTQAKANPAQDTVVDVQDPRPAHGGEVHAKGVAAQQVIVQEGCAQVVGGAHSVDVTSEMEVDVLHREDLTVASPGATTLDAEDGAQGRLPDGDGGAHTESIETLCQPDRRRRLALAQRGGRDGRDDDLSTVRAVGETVEDVEADLGLVAAVELDLLRPETHLLSDVGDGTQLRVLGDP